MEKLFMMILNMSLTAGAVILAVVAVRFLLRKAPKKYSYLLWLVVAFRLCCPVSVPSPLSIFNLQPAGLGGETAVDVPYRGGDGQSSLTTMRYWEGKTSFEEMPGQNEGLQDGYNDIRDNDIQDNDIRGDSMSGQGDSSGEEDSRKTTKQVNWGSLVPYLWAAGAAVMAGNGVIGWLMTKRRVAKAVRLRDRIYVSDQVRSPFVMGLLAPKIYLPCGLEERAERYMLMHEYYHLRRGDHWVKLFAYFLLTLHWFNPLCWLAFTLMVSDMEMSCDEHVLSIVGNIRKSYSSALLSVAVNQRLPEPGPLAFGGTSVKSRIKHVLRFKLPRKGIGTVCALLCIVVLAACGMNPTVVPSSGKETDSDSQTVSDPTAGHTEGMGTGENETGETETRETETEPGSQGGNAVPEIDLSSLATGYNVTAHNDNSGVPEWMIDRAKELFGEEEQLDVSEREIEYGFINDRWLPVMDYNGDGEVDWPYLHNPTVEGAGYQGIVYLFCSDKTVLPLGDHLVSPYHGSSHMYSRDLNGNGRNELLYLNCYSGSGGESTVMSAWTYTEAGWTAFELPVFYGSMEPFGTYEDGTQHLLLPLGREKLDENHLRLTVLLTEDQVDGTLKEMLLSEEKISRIIALNDEEMNACYLGEDGEIDQTITESAYINLITDWKTGQTGMRVVGSLGNKWVSVDAVWETWYRDGQWKVTNFSAGGSADWQKTSSLPLLYLDWDRCKAAGMTAEKLADLLEHPVEAVNRAIATPEEYSSAGFTLGETYLRFPFDDPIIYGVIEFPEDDKHYTIHLMDEQGYYTGKIAELEIVSTGENPEITLTIDGEVIYFTVPEQFR